MVAETVGHKAVEFGGGGETEADLGTAAGGDAGITLDDAGRSIDLVEERTSDLQQFARSLSQNAGHTDADARFEVAWKSIVLAHR